MNTFLPDYIGQEILEKDSFQSLDTGVGQLVEMAVAMGRKTKKGLKCGICGEHGGDPAPPSASATRSAWTTSPAPFRVPIARPPRAQAALDSKKQMKD
ncbi:MAG: hypothetical protein R3C45_14815 [Phycisphaerales bacterium]